MYFLIHTSSIHVLIDSSDIGWDYLEIWLNGDPEYAVDGMPSFPKPGYYPLQEFHPSCVRLPHSALHFVNSQLPNLGIVIPSKKTTTYYQPSTPSTPSTPMLRTTVTPVESFRSSYNIDSEMVALQQQHLAYRATSNNDADSSLAASILSAFDAPLKGSAPEARELYSSIMQKVKVMVKAHDSIPTDSTKKTDLYNRLVQLSYNCDQILFGSDQITADESLKSSAPPRFLSSMGLPLLSAPSNQTGTKSKRRRRSSSTRIMQYDTSSEDDEHNSDDEEESKFVKRASN
jgi:hypothetical protein